MTDAFDLTLDPDRLGRRLRELGEIGRDPAGGRTRLALTAQDGEARDLIVNWLRQAGAQVHVDRIGNIYGVAVGESAGPPVMTGSHIDTVTGAGAYDGCYGVVAGIEILQVLHEHGHRPRRSLAVVAFTNEEGVRFAPDLLGSRVLAGSVPLEDALAIRSQDGVVVGDQLRQIGYAGDVSPRRLLPCAFIELHIEQGPCLDAAGIPIGVVEAVQGHSWWRVVIEGIANHAGTTPMEMRRDAGAAAIALAARVLARARHDASPSVATIGSMALEPGAINVVPGRATFTLDLRDPLDEALRTAEQWLDAALRELHAAGFKASSHCLSRHPAVRFDASLCTLLEALAGELRLPSQRMASGASHDAQMIAGVCPTAMIFVPSRLGISHNPAEHTEAGALVAGAGLLLRAMLRLAEDPPTLST